MLKGTFLGIGKGLDARECARTAAQRALDGLGTSRPVLAVVVISQDLDVQQALSGLIEVLGNTPIWGCSAASPFSSEGKHSHTVLVGVVSGIGMKAQTHFYPEYSRDSKAVGRQLSQTLQEMVDTSGVLLCTDGINGNFYHVASAFSIGDYPVGGAQVFGGYHIELPRMISGAQAGAGAMAAVVLGGALHIGIGFGHGWKPTGLQFEVTRARDVWIQSLNGLPAVEAYAQILGYTPGQWAQLPLSSMVRLYPLGFRSSPASDELVLRSPLHVEVDGSFRTNVPIPEGESAYLLAGDIPACLAEAGKSVRHAVESLNGARPMMALVFVDYAWKLLFSGRDDELITALHSELGDIPMLGCYTFGQVSRPHSVMLPQQLNQYIMVVLLGEKRSS
ncbi:MAG: FIST C-terminal domain-containing protein [Anaerolineaceae bacterium]|nr:FIST C-terminal domain-containing protein [Anaerolineaceae bacterium]